MSIAIGVSFTTKLMLQEKDARLRERRLKHHGSDKAELKKRFTNSLMSVSQIGAGRSEMGQPTV